MDTRSKNGDRWDIQGHGISSENVIFFMNPPVLYIFPIMRYGSKIILIDKMIHSSGFLRLLPCPGNDIHT